MVRFQIYTTLGFSGLPAPEVYHAKSIPVIYESALWPGVPADKTVPSQTNVNAALAGIAADYAGPVCLDVERFDLGNQVNADTYIPRYLEILNRCRIAKPAAKFGYYAVVPERNWYDALTGPGTTGYSNWQARNNFTKPVASAADAVFPSLYTIVNDQANWATYAIENIREARRLAGAKPCYPFLWPQLDQVQPPYNNIFMPGVFWRLQLETLRSVADGCVLWSSTTHLPAFDSNLPWWVEMQNFATALAASEMHTKAQQLQINALILHGTELVARIAEMQANTLQQLQAELVDVNTQLQAIDPTIPPVA